MATRTAAPDEVLDPEDEDELIDDSWEFGRVDDVDTLPDLKPIPFKLYGYEMPDKEEHVFVFHARATSPFGATMEVYRHMRPDGTIPTGPCIDFMYDCIIDEDRPRWKEIVHQGDLHFEPDAILAMAQKLIDFYGGANGTRPTLPRRARRATTKKTSGTSTRARSGRATPSKRSTRTTR